MRFRLVSYIVVAVLSILSLSDASAQSSKPSENIQPFRTRLIPYHSAAAAAEHGMHKQRYMQPITEWQSSDNVLKGEYTYPFSWLERRVFIRVEGVGAPYEIYINGKCAGGSNNGFGAAEYDITKISKEDKNSVELRLLSQDKISAIECFDKPATFSPKAYIISQPRVRVRDIAWRTSLGTGATVNVNFDVTMHNETLGAKRSRIYYELYLNDTIRLDGGYRDVSLGMYGVDTMRFGSTVVDSLLWSAENPVHLSLRLKNRIEGRDVEFYDMPIAMREIAFDNGAFVINNKRVDIVWREMVAHSSVDDVARAYSDGCRAIRFLAGEVSDDVLSYCDANGVYVAVTAPVNSWLSGESRKRGKNPSNNPKWCDDYVERTLQMAYNVMRHPSVIALFLADKSSNGIALYESYLALCAVAGTRPVFYFDGGNEWNSFR